MREPAATSLPGRETLSDTLPKRGKVPSWVFQAAGYGFSAICLAWVMHKYDWHELIPTIRQLEWRWVLLAVVADLAVYVSHGWRWQTLLEPVVRLRLWRTVQAIYIGLFANEVLPLRTGEVIRCYLLAHWNNVRISLSLASAAVERLIDGFWMVGAFLITAGLVRRIPKDLTILAQIIAGLLIFCGILLLWVVARKHEAHAVIAESRWAATLRHIVEGLSLMGSPQTLGKTALISLVYLFLQFISVWALMKADGLDLSFWSAAGVLTLVRFGTVVPNAPGNVGLFQVAVVVALRLFDVEKNDATNFSFIMFFALTIPLLVGGAIATALTGLNLSELRERAHRSVSAGHLSPSPVPRPPSPPL
jgi:glycosyltransferase 2 family protein